MACIYILDKKKKFESFHATVQIILISNPKCNKILASNL